MRLLILSDIHLEFHRDNGDEYIDSLPTKGIDGVVLAGDICALSQFLGVLENFCQRYSKVIYLWGNHETYAYSIDSVREAAKRAQDKLDNLVVLDNNRVEVFDGIFFVGGTMWFPYDSENFRYEYYMNDFNLIKNIRETVYEENEKTVNFFRDNIKRGDIVVTHHLPSSMSVHPRFEGHPLNRFFLCDVEDIIKECQPKLWIHGHTHESFNYTVFATRVVCNPFWLSP